MRSDFSRTRLREQRKAHRNNLFDEPEFRSMKRLAIGAVVVGFLFYGGLLVGGLFLVKHLFFS